MDLQEVLALFTAHLESVTHVDNLVTSLGNALKTWLPSSIKIWVLVWALITSDHLKDREEEDVFLTLDKCIIFPEATHLLEGVDQEEEEEIN